MRGLLASPLGFLIGLSLGALGGGGDPGHPGTDLRCRAGPQGGDHHVAGHRWAGGPVGTHPIVFGSTGGLTRSSISCPATPAGGSSGGHNAYMLALTGVPGYHFAAAVGWSGLPDAGASGAYARSVFDRYMRASPGSDRGNFGDPYHRITANSPPQYIANGLTEFIAPANAVEFKSRCLAVGGKNLLAAYQQHPRPCGGLPQLHLYWGQPGADDSCGDGGVRAE